MARATAKLVPGPVLAQLEALKRKHVVIGVLGGEAAKQHGEATNADVATWMEFGTTTPDGRVHVPERSFLRSTLRLKAGDIRAFIDSRVRRVMAGKLDADAAYEQIGQKVVALVKGTIRAGISPPLARKRTRTDTERKTDKRRAKKGLEKIERVGVPLIDTSQLLGSITNETRSK